MKIAILTTISTIAIIALFANIPHSFAETDNQDYIRYVNQIRCNVNPRQNGYTINACLDTIVNDIEYSWNNDPVLIVFEENDTTFYADTTFMRIMGWSNDE